MKLAHLISKVTTPIFLGLLYIIMFTGVGGIVRPVGKRPMIPKKVGQSYWIREALLGSTPLATWRRVVSTAMCVGF